VPRRSQSIRAHRRHIGRKPPPTAVTRHTARRQKGTHEASPRVLSRRLAVARSRRAPAAVRSPAPLICRAASALPLAARMATTGAPARAELGSGLLRHRTASVVPATRSRPRGRCSSSRQTRWEMRPAPTPGWPSWRTWWDSPTKRRRMFVLLHGLRRLPSRRSQRGASPAPAPCLRRGPGRAM